jgi:pyruvate/2-oxoglutarate dehydrogenase complex dihydrolipoamide acyltransferase (E2) component
MARSERPTFEGESTMSLSFYRMGAMTEIKVPTIPGAGTKLSIGRWFKRVGDPVTVHEPLVEIDTDNVIHEIRTPVTGLLSKILVRDGETVESGTVVGIIDPM